MWTFFAWSCWYFCLLSCRCNRRGKYMYDISRIECLKYHCFEKILWYLQETSVNNTSDHHRLISGYVGHLRYLTTCPLGTCSPRVMGSKWAIWPNYLCVVIRYDMYCQNRQNSVGEITSTIILVLSRIWFSTCVYSGKVRCILMIKFQRK